MHWLTRTLVVLLAAPYAECGTCVMREPVPIEPDELPQFLSAHICGPFFDEYYINGPYGRECAYVPFLDEGECMAAVEPYLEDSVQASLNAGLQFSNDCLKSVSGREAEAEGLNIVSGTWFDCEVDCQFFSGEQPEGAPCDSLGHRMSDCQQGLVCAADRTCHGPCDLPFVAPEGGYCGPARGMWFVVCGPGLACGSDGTCELASPLGDPCDASTPCAVEGWCDPDSSSCVARFPAGGSCTEHDQCASDLCGSGECVQPESLECGRWGW
jgi:hypothetical protein